MMNNNKILTVSYGTFSCTLEGFDDSFGTMKAIAEYFRDLAADDRYFGAEPPQPDAEMLARIAQKEVSRRVEAREQDGKIVLSALEDQSGQAPSADALALAGAAAAVAAAPQETEELAQAESPVEEPPAKEAPVEEAVIEIEEPVTDVDVTDVNDAIVIATASAGVDALELDTTPQMVIEEAASVDADDVKAAEIAAGEETAVEAQAADFVEDENDIVPGQPDAEVEAFFADSPAPQEEATAEQAALAEVIAPAAPAPAPDSIAAKLQRIRAVVAQHEEVEEEDDYLEDEHADGTAQDVVADARADIEDALEADDEAASDAAPEETDADDVSAILSRLENTDEAIAPTAEVEEAASDALKEVNLADLEDTSGAPSVEDTVSNLFEEAKELAAAPEAEEAEAEPQAKAPEAPQVSLRKTPRGAPTEETADDPAIADDAAATPEEAPTPRARVIKVKRADLEAAIEKGDLEEYGDDEDAAAEEMAAAPAEDAPTAAPKLDELAPARGNKQTALSPDDEAELARELADLKADISASAEEAEAKEDVTPKRVARQPGETARNVLPSIDEGNETDVNRLLAETDHQMDEPESATRRDAFAHLRAAVAAKKADVAMGDDASAEDSDGAYREDLAEVVRPRRPVSATARTERPSEGRPAPLKLVAEQRIDVAQPAAAAGPVRPRRISAATEEAPEAPEGESFTDFAADMGASTLPQLLEAAAAYMSFVEGREQFSRPQLMTKVRQANGPDGFSREEGLRSFGQLLRAGKIEKIKGGRFTVSDDIGYRPDQRAAG